MFILVLPSAELMHFNKSTATFYLSTQILIPPLELILYAYLISVIRVGYARYRFRVRIVSSSSVIDD